MDDADGLGLIGLNFAAVLTAIVDVHIRDLEVGAAQQDSAVASHGDFSGREDPMTFLP